MKAAVFGAPHDIHMEERPRPEPDAGEVRVAVRATGVCAGDLYIYAGSNPYVSYPRIGGHEIAGILDKLGPDTIGPAVGTPVVVEPFVGCGICYACRVGKSNCCANLHIIGVHSDGGFAQYVIAPVDRLHKIPANMPAHKASFAEPVAIGLQACRRGEIMKGDRVLILGAGPIGLALIEVAQSRGASVFVTDIDRERLDAAAGLGATALAAGDALVDEVGRHTDGQGMPAVIEATGNPKVMESTIDLVAAGGRIVIVGLAKKGQMVHLAGLDLTRKEVTLLGSRASVDCFPESLELIAGGAIGYTDTASLFTLDAAVDVFSRLSKPGSGIQKAVFTTTSGD